MNSIKNYLKRIFGSSSNKTISKKDVFFGILSSHFAILIYINIIYLIHVISLFYKDKTAIIVFSMPVIMCIFPLFFYCYNVYKQEMLYLFIRNKKNNKLLSLFFITSSCLFSFIPLDLFFIFLIIVLNSTVCVFIYLHYHFNCGSFYSLRIVDNFVFLDGLNKIKIAIINPSDDTQHLSFLSDMKFFFNHRYVVFKGYKISYSDLYNLELNFNKTLYNFNDAELKIVEMYAIN